MIDDELLRFINSSIPSIWALDVLAVFIREPRKAWQTEELIREVRGSATAVSASVAALLEAGLVAEISAASFVYQPDSPRAPLATALLEAYGKTPVAVVKAIMSSPSDKIRSFADAFIVKRKRD